MRSANIHNHITTLPSLCEQILQLTTCPSWPKPKLHVGQRIQLGDGFGNQNVECGKALADLDDIQNIGDDKG